MADRSRKSVQTEKNYNYNTYIDGNTVRKLDVAPQELPKHKEKQNKRTQTNPNKERRMNLGNVLFLATAVATVAVILVGYIQLRADLTLTTRKIASLESELNGLKLMNDEEYNRALSSVDLEEIRRVAIGELGMRYAKQGQVINVSGEGSDYVRQLAPIE